MNDKIWNDEFKNNWTKRIKKDGLKNEWKDLKNEF